MRGLCVGTVRHVQALPRGVEIGEQVVVALVNFRRHGDQTSSMDLTEGFPKVLDYLQW